MQFVGWMFFSRYLDILFFLKASFFTEIREVVRQEDLIRFDRLIFGRRGNLFDLLLADTSSPSSIPPQQQPAPQSSPRRRSMRIKQQMHRPPPPPLHQQPINTAAAATVSQNNFSKYCFSFISYVHLKKI